MARRGSDCWRIWGSREKTAPFSLPVLSCVSYSRGVQKKTPYTIPVRLDCLRSPPRVPSRLFCGVCSDTLPSAFFLLLCRPLTIFLIVTTTRLRPALLQRSANPRSFHPMHSYLCWLFAWFFPPSLFEVDRPYIPLLCTRIPVSHTHLLPHLSLYVPFLHSLPSFSLSVLIPFFTLVFARVQSLFLCEKSIYWCFMCVVWLSLEFHRLELHSQLFGVRPEN